MSSKKYKQEEWKSVNGYEGLYEISSFGRIKTLRYNRMLSNYCRTNKYCIVSLVKAGVRVGYSVHRLVAITFIHNPENKSTVNHKNGVKSDNRVVNLEWATLKENIIHAHNTGIINVPSGDKNSMFGRTGFNSTAGKSVNQIDITTGVVIKKWGSARQAALFLNKTHGVITQCCREKWRTSCGYKWEYANA